MYKAIVFAGTTEGYELCRFLAEHQVQVLGCVATEYGTKSLSESSFLHVQIFKWIVFSKVLTLNFHLTVCTLECS